MKKQYTTKRILTLTVQDVYWAVASRHDLTNDAQVTSLQVLPDGTVEIRTTETGEVEL